ncbi:hypothetical protein N9995_00025 [bacterium]|jgi:hypothetical protein|nr:hypothetical protein [bacterium]
MGGEDVVGEVRTSQCRETGREILEERTGKDKDTIWRVEIFFL